MIENKKIIIKWQRLISNDETCPRCESTEEEIEEAVYKLRKCLSPLDIEIILEKSKLSIKDFKKDPLKSNMIFLNDKLLEDWINAKISQNECCGVCGPSQCRTIEADGKVHERVPEYLIIKAGFLAALSLIG